MRHPNDFYRTPAWCTRRVLETLNGWKPTLDPCAGDGAILLECHGTVGIELYPPSEGMHVLIEQGDGLAVSWRGEDVIMNPPFSNIMEWVQKAQEAASALVLMRTGVLGGVSRKAFWEAHPPSVIRFLSKRPSFTSDGKTDWYDYAWIGWGINAAPLGWI